MLKRVWLALTHDVKEDPDDDQPQILEEIQPWQECRWVQIDVRCRIPLNDSENWPNGCSSECPARLANEYKAQLREAENARIYR